MMLVGLQLKTEHLMSAKEKGILNAVCRIYLFLSPSWLANTKGGPPFEGIDKYSLLMKTTREIPVAPMTRDLTPFLAKIHLEWD